MRRLFPSAHRLGLVLARAAAALAVVTAAGAAAAESDFPGVIQDTLGSSCAPQCTLCHTRPTGGAEFLKGSEAYVEGMTTPGHRGYGVFISNLAMRSPSGTPSKTNLPKKLASLQKEPCNSDPMLGMSDGQPCDSDGDGKSDYDELKAGLDPDTPGPGPECPAYGCGASISTLPHDADASGRAGALMAAIGVALVLARRVRR